ncbi:uncharacterized protein LOC121867577 isoform X2 [Homarus americanus]|nr:uncharacterized protein LOC121867577 isoform X2 [Homarus americanus]
MGQLGIWWTWTTLLTLAQIYLYQQEGGLTHTLQPHRTQGRENVYMHKHCVKITCWRWNLRYPIINNNDHRLVRYLRHMIDPPPHAAPLHHHPLWDAPRLPPPSHSSPTSRRTSGRFRHHQQLGTPVTDPDHPPWENITSYKAIERTIRDLLGNTVGGVFVEMGSQDGLWLSNSWWLEVVQGWQGLLVEADPLNYIELRASPRTSRTLPVCVTTGDIPKQELMVRRRHPELWNTTLGMHQRGQSMMARSAAPTNLYLGETWNTTCYPLFSVLAAAGYKQV